MAAQPLVVRGWKEDGRVLVADETLQGRVRVLAVLAEALLQARPRSVRRLVLAQIGVGAVLASARVDVGVVVAVGADDQLTGATWRETRANGELISVAWLQT